MACTVEDPARDECYESPRIADMPDNAAILAQLTRIADALEKRAARPRKQRKAVLAQAEYEAKHPDEPATAFGDAAWWRAQFEHEVRAAARLEEQLEAAQQRKAVDRVSVAQAIWRVIGDHGPNERLEDERFSVQDYATRLADAVIAAMGARALPEEATNAMVDAGGEAVMEAWCKGLFSKAFASEVWRVMLAEWRKEVNDGRELHGLPGHGDDGGGRERD